jgi:phage tail-like protein
MSWLSSMTTGVTVRTASISAMTADGKVIAKWSLMGVIPVRWTGPSLNLDSPKVATETLEIAHHGFGPGGGVRS